MVRRQSRERGLFRLRTVDEIKSHARSNIHLLSTITCSPCTVHSLFLLPCNVESSLLFAYLDNRLWYTDSF